MAKRNETKVSNINPIAKHAHVFNRCVRMQIKTKKLLTRKLKHKAQGNSSGSFL